MSRPESCSRWGLIPSYITAGVDIIKHPTSLEDISMYQTPSILATFDAREILGDAFGFAGATAGQGSDHEDDR